MDFRAKHTGYESQFILSMTLQAIFHIRNDVSDFGQYGQNPIVDTFFQENNFSIAKTGLILAKRFFTSSHLS
jgi:hypothetical protein